MLKQMTSKFKLEQPGNVGISYWELQRQDEVVGGLERLGGLSYRSLRLSLWGLQLLH